MKSQFIVWRLAIIEKMVLALSQIFLIVEFHEVFVVLVLGLLDVFLHETRCFLD